MKILASLILGLFGAVAALAPAQVVAFGLSYYGIHTGLFANWLLVVALEGIITAAIMTANFSLED